jgi:hypothetical protein
LPVVELFAGVELEYEFTLKQRLEYFMLASRYFTSQGSSNRQAFSRNCLNGSQSEGCWKQKLHFWFIALSAPKFTRGSLDLRKLM